MLTLLPQDLILNSTSYIDVCNSIMSSVKPKLAPEVYEDVYNTMCITEVEELTQILYQLNLNDVASLVW